MMHKLFRRYSKIMHNLLILRKFSEAEVRANARKYGDSIMWLADENLVHLCRNVHKPYLPLTANAMEDDSRSMCDRLPCFRLRCRYRDQHPFPHDRTIYIEVAGKLP